jgi:DNA-binding NtrC family response regulator
VADPERDRTDLQARLPLSLVGRRSRPRMEWTDSGGEHAVVIDQRLLVGASPGVHAIVADPTVSRLHAELDPREDGVWVRDLGSSNGTWIDGVLVQAGRLPEGGTLRMGATSFRLRYDEEEKVPLWPSDHFGPLFGRSEAIREVFFRMSQYADRDAAVLVQGETGTGKELIARALHDASPRAAEPFVIVDCAALPENLLESELFGHLKGAFTGAVSTRAGALETAQGGTVFLDEIGELPLSMQPKLLRAIESRTVRRIGEATHRKVDVRFVSATHRDLQSMVNAGAFREDLYFRLSVLPLHVPALRDRREDVPLLLDRMLGGLEPLRAETEAALVAHPWLGNVRELRNFAERVRTIGLGPALSLLQGGEPPSAPRASRAPPPMSVAASAKELPLPPPPIDRPFKEIREAWNDHLEREYLKGLVAKLGRNVAAIADAAEIDRTYIRRLMRKHEL